MYGDVDVSIEDGKLSSDVSNGKGIHVKIGVSSASQIVHVKSNMSAEDIVRLLGNSPLADACMDSIENGSNDIYCLPIQACTDGTVSAITHTGSGKGTVVISGKPCNQCEVIIEVVESGNTNDGAVKYSIDGGYTYSDEETIPLSGELVLANTGLTAKFADEEDNQESFVDGDKYSFTTTAPTLNNSDIISSIESLKNFTKAFEFVHVVGITGTPAWASIATLANAFVTKYKRPMFFVCESRNKNTSEENEAYINAMNQSVSSISNIYVQVVSSYGTYVRMDGRTIDTNLAAVLCGMYCKARESQSIGEVKSFPISTSKLIKLVPDGIEECTEELDSLRFATVRRYYGKNDFFVTSANMLHPDNSDYKCAEDVRVLNRLVRDVRLKALEELQSEIDPEDIEASLESIKENLMIPVESAMSDGIISSGKINIDPDVDILVDESIDIEVVYVPMGHIREMKVKFSVENPNS